jgi:hypothetical protein
MLHHLRRRSWILRVLVLGGVGLALAAPALGSDGTEFACEEAAAHLASCCPDFDPQQLDCTYSFGCDGSDPNPQFSREESECIQSLDCDELRDGGVCEQATNGGLISCE